MMSASSSRVGPGAKVGRQRGWTPAALAQWLSDSLAAALLRPG